MAAFIENIDAVIRLTEEEKRKIKEVFVPKAIPKGEFYIQEGAYCNTIAFIQKGRLRVYYFDDKGHEITCYFGEAGTFISSYTSYLTLTPTKENIEAMEDCELWAVNRITLEQLSREIPKLEVFRRVIAENLFIMMERRIGMLQSQPAQERYETALKETPELILNVPLQYTASFLGITPQHLSRLRKKYQK